MTEKLFFDLIRVAIGNQACLSHSPTTDEWGKLYDMAKKQSLVGVCFAGVQKLVNSEREDYCGMNELQYLTWMGMAAKIQQKNEVVNRQCETLGKQLQDAGFNYVVMKGQEVGRYYTSTGSAQVQSLSTLRQSGDIDVWITNKGRKDIVAYAEKVSPTKEINHHHLHFHVFDDTEVELHFLPIELHCPWYDQSLRKFMRSQVKSFAMCEGGYMVPTVEFDLLHQLAHSFRHLFGDGIGMRQVMDFYFTLQEALRRDNVDWEAVNRAIRSTGMKCFTEAMLWIMHEVFGLPNSNLSTLNSNLKIGPNEQLGRFLLNEVMLAGNFGHTDERIKHGSNESAWHRFWRVNKQNLKLMRFSVWEVLCTPPWRIVNYLWMRSHGYGMGK